MEQAIHQIESPATDQHAGPGWKEYQKFLFRIAFIFFIAISIPNNANWYAHVFSIDWTNLHYRDLYDIARFGSGINFFGNTIFGSTLSGYANWIISLLFAIGGALIWTAAIKVLRRDNLNYPLFYYWLRVVVRYRAGIGIIGFGFTKLFPVQMPYPGHGILNTDFGDLTSQKIYWLSIAIVPWYQVFAGIVEITAGTLLFFRRTTLIGAILLFGALGDIVYVNFAYDGGVHVYSSYFVLLAGFILIPYIPALWSLIVQERVTHFKLYYPKFTESWQQLTRYALKSGTIVVFLVLFLWLQYINFRYDPYKQPSTKGVTDLRGHYDVVSFKLNGEEIPVDPTDSVRWSEASFEKWTSLTFKVNRKHPLDLSNGGGDPQRDINRTFEIAGVGGGRRVFHYYADTIEQVLYLQDKYKTIPDRRNRTAGVGGDGATDGQARIAVKASLPASGIYSPDWISEDAWKRIGDENKMIDPRAASTRRDREFAANKGKYDNRKRMVLHYSTADNGNTITLKGLDENQDSVEIALKRIDRKYALTPSTLDAGKY